MGSKKQNEVDKTMTPKQTIDIIKAAYTIQNDVECFYKLRDFFSNMLCGQHTEIFDEEIHRGMDYVKEGMKTTLKSIKNVQNMEYANETDIGLFCEKMKQYLLSYNHLYE